ncbi:LysR family transcriptional regulator [Kordiimonas sp. SCSIO 12603]|uniref:LysR family transcriptional regulator n=1 Tax=Kordiimonas sp. SCSIO 12603 TaxID=2829596 RepID=UPI002102A5EB|nr:LysR family transcriptional regulator [Kordiimonas sp. SCSIO 12603]UTW59212.1 LysR family transcriptional regulator [Kordiimonas sp. SCSIO 12603]
MIRLGLHHLAMIKSLNATGNVSATARELGLTQSAISHRMKEAERRVNTQIFHRDSHSIVLTQAGKRLLRSAEIILEEATAAERDLDHLSTGHRMVLRMGATCYMGFDWYPSFLHALEKKLPDCMVEIAPTIDENPANLLNDQVADFVLMAGTLEQPDLKNTPLFTDELVAVLPPNHPRCGEAFLQPDMFREEVYATHHTLPETGREYETLFKPAGIYPKEVISAGQTQAIFELILAGRAITILPRWPAQVHAKRLGLTLKPIGPKGTPIKWHASYKKSSKQETVIQQILGILKETTERE